MAMQAIVRRALPTNDELTVRLSSTDTTKAIVPAEVVIPANQATATFYVTAVDNVLVDGSTTVVLSAVGVIPSCGCSADNPTGTATAELAITDDDGPTLRVTFDKAMVREGVTAAANITVHRNTATTDPLVVSLVSGDPAKLVVPATVTIPEGADAVQVPLDTLSDGATAGSQTISVTASAGDFTAGEATIVVTDVDVPDLLISSINAPTTAVTEAYFNVAFGVTNEGLAPAEPNNAVPPEPGTWIDRVFLSSDEVIGDDVLIGDYTFTGSMGSEAPLIPSMHGARPCAAQAGDYWVVVTTDLGNAVAERVETNNTTISGAKPVHVEPAFTATVAANVDVAPAGTSVVLSGHATKTDTGGPAAYAMVNIQLNVRGFKRTMSAIANDVGNFNTTFTPLPGEAGHYTVPPSATLALTPRRCRTSSLWSACKRSHLRRRSR